MCTAVGRRSRQRGGWGRVCRRIGACGVVAGSPASRSVAIAMSGRRPRAPSARRSAAPVDGVRGRARRRAFETLEVTDERRLLADREGRPSQVACHQHGRLHDRGRARGERYDEAGGVRRRPMERPARACAACPRPAPSRRSGSGLGRFRGNGNLARGHPWPTGTRATPTRRMTARALGRTWPSRWRNGRQSAAVSRPQVLLRVLTNFDR